MNDPAVVDTYADEGPHDWSALPDWVVGAILKVSQGVTVHHDDWLALTVSEARRCAHVGGFHYLDLLGDGAAQAAYYLAHAQAAYLHALPWDFLPIVDVEWETGDRNSTASADQVISCVEAFAEVIHKAFGSGPILYSNCGMLASKNITSRMGCSWFWPARYTATLPAHDARGDGYVDVGWSIDRIPMWQFAGDGQAMWSGRPARIVGFGKCDVSVAIAPNGAADEISLRRATIQP